MMNFLCDVHISLKVAAFLKSLGHEAIHINDILDGYYTKDKDICSYADLNNMIVVTKDVDFRNSFFVSGTPKKLIKVNLGNISTNELINVFSMHIKGIEKISKNESFLIELHKNHVSYIT